MPALAYAYGAYQRADLPQLRVLNQYVETVPAQEDVPAVLLARPVLTLQSEIGGGPIRGVFSAPNVLAGDVFAVSGSVLFRGTTALGAIPGTDRVMMASTPSVVMVAYGSGMATTDGVALTTTAFPDGAGVTAVGYLAGYAFAIRAGSRRLYFTLDPATWDGLDYVSAEQDTGDIVGYAIVSDQIWLFCQRTTEIFTPTGNPDIPFQRVEGRLYDKGCIARDTIAKADNSVTWIGDDRIVYRGDNAPVRISDFGIEERLLNTPAADLRAWVFPWNGHTFYALRTAEGTFVYDYATQQWAEAGTYGRDVWRAHVGTFREGVVIAGDDTEGKLWNLSGTAIDEAGDALDRRFTAVLKEAPVIVDNLVLDCSVGEAPTFTATPVIEMRQSRDGGATWVDWRATSLGERGRRRWRAVWRRCGMADGDTVFEFRTTDGAPWRLSSVKINESLSGRSR